MASLRTLTRSFGALSLPSTSRSVAQPLGARPSLFACSPPLNLAQQVRHKGNLAPRKTKYRKAHKGRVPIAIGGSIKGTTLQQGSFGIRLLGPARLTAKQLESAEAALKRKLKVVKGAQVYMRPFPDIPVCVKGNETRMGKGKGAFEYWACRVRQGQVVFEVGGTVEIRAEVAKEALRLAAAKLPVRTEFITLADGARLGNLKLDKEPLATAAVVLSQTPPAADQAAIQGATPAQKGA